MNNGPYYVFFSAVLASFPCLAGDTLRLPTLQEGEWTMSTVAITSDGQTFRTPESAIACMQPTRDMQRDLAHFEKRGCKTVPVSSADTEVRFTVSCPARRGIEDMNVTLTVPNLSSYRQFIVSPLGTNELKARRLGPCKAEVKQHFDRHLDD